jgi:hypothetical protein
VDGIEAAQLARKGMATGAWSKATQAQPAMLSLLKMETSEVQWPTNVLQDYTNAITRCKTLEDEIVAINDAGKAAAVWILTNTDRSIKR